MQCYYSLLPQAMLDEMSADAAAVKKDEAASVEGYAELKAAKTAGVPSRETLAQCFQRIASHRIAAPSVRCR